MSSDDLVNFASGSLEHQVPSVGGLQQLLQSTLPLPRPSQSQQISAKLSSSFLEDIPKSWKILEILNLSVCIKFAALIYLCLFGMIRICAAYHIKIRSKLSKSLFDAFQIFGLHAVPPGRPLPHLRPSLLRG